MHNNYINISLIPVLFSDIHVGFRLRQAGGRRRFEAFSSLCGYAGKALGTSYGRSGNVPEVWEYVARAWRDVANDSGYALPVENYRRKKITQGARQLQACAERQLQGLHVHYTVL